MINAATLSLEDFTGIKFIEQVWDVFLDRWPATSKNIWFDGVREMSQSELVNPERNVILPIGVAKEFIHFKTFSDNAEFTENLSDYIFDTVKSRARIGLKLSGVWPTTILRSNNGINFRVKVGFGAVDDVPFDIKQSIMEYVSHMYENRGDQNEMTIPPHIYTLLNGRKRVKIGKNI